MPNNLTQKIKENFNLDLTLKIISFLCVISFVDNFYSVFSETIHDRAQFSNSLNFFVKTFQNVIFGTLLVSLFFKFKYRYIGFIMPIAYMEQADNIFSNQLHNFLLQSGFYNLFSKNPWLISPEYPRIILFLGILLASFILLFTKWRNFKRIFLTFGAGGVFLTSVLFHSIIIYEIESFKAHDSKTMQAISSVSESLSDVKKSCLINQYDCYFYPVESEQNLFEDSNIPQPIKKELPYLKPYFMESKPFFWYGVSHDSTAMNRLIGQTPFSISRNEQFSLIIKNGGSYKEFFIINQYVFAWLALASHTVWFLGALFLIFFHEKRFKRNNSNRQQS